MGSRPVLLGPQFDSVQEAIGVEATRGDSGTARRSGGVGASALDEVSDCVVLPGRGPYITNIRIKKSLIKLPRKFSDSLHTRKGLDCD